MNRSTFAPAFWLPGPHFQTIWASKFRRLPCPKMEKERIELDDGDFLQLFWVLEGNGPMVIILHGLEGDETSNNVKAMFSMIRKEGWNGVMLLNRNCGGVCNRLQRTYHAGETTDLNWLVELVKKRLPGKPIMLFGYSLGGNTLLKWLGEKGEAAGIDAAAAVSIPFDLSSSTDRMNRGFSKVYQKHFIDLLKVSAKRKFLELPPPFDPGKIERIRTLREFDDRITAPLHGFKDAEDYYSKSSCKGFLKHIKVPTLIMNSFDDPFLETSTFAKIEEVSELVELENHQKGGHAAFITGVPWNKSGWTETRIPEFYKSHWKD